MHEVPKNVVDDYMTFLHAMNAVGLHHQAVVQSDLRHLATAHSSQPDGRYTHFLCFQKSLYQVVGVSAGGETDQTVPGASLRNQLTDKHVLETDIIGNRTH